MFRRSNILSLFLVSLLVLLITMPSINTASPSKIYGFVTWSNGTPVSGATVTIKNLNSSGSLETKTNGNGYYSFDPGLFSNEPDPFAKTGEVLNITVVYEGKSGTTSESAEFVLGNETGYYQKEMDISLTPISHEDGFNMSLYSWIGIMVVLIILIGAIMVIITRKKRKGDR